MTDSCVLSKIMTNKSTYDYRPTRRISRVKINSLSNVKTDFNLISYLQYVFFSGFMVFIRFK